MTSNWFCWSFYWYCLFFCSEEWPLEKLMSWASLSGKPSQNRTSRNPRVRNARRRDRETKFGFFLSWVCFINDKRLSEYFESCSVCLSCLTHWHVSVVLHAGWIGSQLVLKCSSDWGLSELKCVLPWWWEDYDLVWLRWRAGDERRNLSLAGSPTLVLCHIYVLWITVFEIDSKCNAEPLKRSAATRAFSILLVHRVHCFRSCSEFALDPDVVVEPKDSSDSSLCFSPRFNVFPSNEEMGARGNRRGGRVKNLQLKLIRLR